jgi:hypothetical protein
MHAWQSLGALTGLVCALLATSARAQSWTDFVSEEQGEGRPALCASGAATGLRCSGRYCDNVSLLCSGPAQGDGSWGPYFSEEGSAEHVCPEGQFVTGLRCSGRYCDNVSLRCSSLPQLSIKSCHWTHDISEESGGTVQYGSGVYLRGVRCSGRYCDNLRSYVCEAEQYDCSTDACRREQARRFAPLLRFDQVQGSADKCFPSDAGAYYEARRSGSRARICNTDVGSIERGEVPTYYEYQECGPDSAVIMYWFFYGYQDTCTGSLGSHDADWERVAVKLRRGRLDRVLYFQHAGSYTRQGRELSYFEDTHPVAFVGKNSHGSYHDDGGSGSCLYFEDYRNPGGRDLRMQTWRNLVELSDAWHAPEWMRTRSAEHFDGIPAPLARDIDLCSLPGCVGNDLIIGSALCFGQCGCAKSSIGSAPF